MTNKIMLDLFSGPGIGASGFQNYYDIVEAIDINQDACNSYKKNHKSTTVKCKDIRDISFLKHDYSGIIGLLATPPCQSFSGLNQKRNTNDDRANLIYEFIRTLQEIKPEFAVFENVYSVPKETKVKFVKEIKKLGYKVVSKTVKASDFGSIQIRKRWITVISTKKHIYPEKIMNTRTAKEILQPINTVPEITFKEATIEKIKQVKDITGKWIALPGQNFKVYYIIDQNKLLPAIVNPTKLRYIYIQNGIIRSMTLTELLSSFGVSNYELSGTTTSKGQQIANGFPKEMAEAFAIELKKYH